MLRRAFLVLGMVVAAGVSVGLLALAAEDFKYVNLSNWQGPFPQQPPPDNSGPKVVRVKTDGYVSCSVGPHFGKAGPGEPCVAPGPETPKDDILYCPGKSRADADPVSDYEYRCYWAKSGP